MSQHDYNVANAPGASVRSDLNDALGAIVTQNSGATAPSTLFPYMLWADTGTGKLQMRNGANTAWVTIGDLDAAYLNLGDPPGVIKMWPTSAAPTGYLLCNGAEISRTTYATLFAVIGTLYGAGDGTTTFLLPDLQGQFVVGKDAGDATFDTLGETGGEKTHTLSESELPSHTHSVVDPGHTHYVTVGAYSGGGGLATGDLTASSERVTSDVTHITISATGSGTPHNTLPPFTVLNYIIKY